MEEYRKPKRGTYPPHVEARVRAMAGRVLGALHSQGVSAEELPASVGASAKWTLARRIRKGTLTLKDMLLISDVYPLDWSAIINGLRVPRRPGEVVDNSAATEPEDYTESEQEFLSRFNLE